MTISGLTSGRLVTLLMVPFSVLFFMENTPTAAAAPRTVATTEAIAAIIKVFCKECKINSLENEYTVSVQCNHQDKGKICNHINKFKIFLSDTDLNPTPNDYQIPKITWRTENTECEYEIIPPTMDIESALFNYFQTERNANPDDIPEDKKLSFDYTFLRAMMHLVKDGKRLVTIESNFNDILNLLKFNKYSQLNHLFDYVLEVDSFGVQNKMYEFKCEECGGTLMFQLPLLDGLTD